MKFLIIAIEHGWQLVPRGAETPATKRLRAFVGQKICERNVSLICEESDPCRLSIAQQIAYEHQPDVVWKNITMSAQERLEAGIWEVLFNREPVETVMDEATGLLQEFHDRIPADDVREHFFAKEAIQAATGKGADWTLILCGDLHADALRDKLQARGHEAEATHELVPVKYWR
jgi:hypothetical protein